MKELIELQAKSVKFYSENDETVFFEWLKNNDAIENIEGHGLSIYIQVHTLRMSEVNFRELIAIFFRYKLDMKQLSQFENKKKFPWFKSKESYWYKKVWGKD